MKCRVRPDVERMRRELRPVLVEAMRLGLIRDAHEAIEFATALLPEYLIFEPES